MPNARDEALQELERLLHEVDMKPSRFAVEAGLRPSTLTRFIRDPAAAVLSTRTLTKLRDARDRILRERATAAQIQQFPKDPDQRAVIAALLALGKDDLVTIKQVIDGISQARRTQRK